MSRFFIIVTFLMTLLSQTPSTYASTENDLNQIVFNKYGSITKSIFNNFALVDGKDTKIAEYDVFYYVPAKLKGMTDIKALFFLHGGGSSTMTRKGSADVAKMYLADLKSVADNLNIALICPSGSAQNWGGHMIDMLRDLKKVAIKDLGLDRNSIGLTGHSMGGMGITRTAHWLASEFSFFMPVAAGYDFKIANERVNPARKKNNSLYLDTYFNHRYLHLQGIHDHFQIFVERAKEQKKRIEQKEDEFNYFSKYELVFYNGVHNYDKSQYQSLLKRELSESRRDPYQKNLFGMEYNIDEMIKEKRGFDFYYGDMNSYFWIEAVEHKEYRKVNSVRASIRDNLITLTLDKNITKVRVYLSSEIVDFSKTISVKVNGANKFFGKVEEIKENKKSLDYSSYVDIEI